MTWGPDADRAWEAEEERRGVESDAFVQWCEEQDPPLDPESEAAEEGWEKFKEDETLATFVPPTVDDFLEMAYEDMQEGMFDATSY